MKAYNDEIYHYGIIGMKWGKRRNTINNKTKSNKRLTISDSGMVTISDKPASRQGKINFTIRSVATIGVMSTTLYMSTHPKQISKAKNTVSEILKKGKTSLKSNPVDSGIYSKTLGRMITIAEALDAGFDLRD